jgi:cytidylate kinase
VLDGRDIGTVIAPDATAKLFVTAAPQVRARRRFDELVRMGLNVHYEDVLLDIRARDAPRQRPCRRSAGDGAGRAPCSTTSELAVEDAIAEAIGGGGATPGTSLVRKRQPPDAWFSAALLDLCQP